MRRVIVLICAVALFCSPAFTLGADKGKDKARQSAPAKKAAVKPAAKTEKAAAKTEKPAAKTAKKPVVALLTLKGGYPEGTANSSLFGELRPSLATIVGRIDAAAADKDVSAVWLKIEGDLFIGRGKIYELRGAIARLRKANKPVYAELTTALGGQYLLAGACEKIVMPPSGMLIIPGVRAEITFFKGLLDKLGLQFDALQMGKYKGAAEPLTRNEMSKPLRESLDALVDDTYDNLVTTIAADRRLKDYQVKTLLDQGLFTAAAAKKAGLIDDVLYADQLQDAIKNGAEGQRRGDRHATTRRRHVDTDFSGISGMMKFFDLMRGRSRRPARASDRRSPWFTPWAPSWKARAATISSATRPWAPTTIVAALRKAAEDAKVSAIVLRIDSPGGSATASDLIWRETVHVRKPLMASMGDVAGSGGYYIAMGAKKIIAAPGTLTGSIGVIGGKLVTRGLHGKLGLNTEVISRGANSGSLSSTQPFTPEERKAWTELLQGDVPAIRRQGGPGAKNALRQAGSAGARPGLHRPDGKEAGPDRLLRDPEGRRDRRQAGGRTEGRRRGRPDGSAGAEIVFRAAFRRPRGRGRFRVAAARRL